MGDGFVALYIFMLAAIAGHVIISRVPVILHTPLMSGSNFIHGIVLIGAMVVLGHADTTLEKAIGFVAVVLGAGNAAGGYVVTERMLEMFKSSKKPEKDVLEELYFAALARAPEPDEVAVALAHVAKAKDKRKGWEDVLWAVINTREFLFRH